MAGMGYALWHRGDKAKTLNVGNVLLEFGRKQDDYRAKGMGYCCIGWSHLIGGDLIQATPYLEKAVQVSMDPWYSLFPKLALAYGLILNGNFQAAEKYIAEIRKFNQQFGAEFAGAPAHFFQGIILVSQGRIIEGLRILEDSCKYWSKNGNKLRYAACGSMLASVYANLAKKARSRNLSKYALSAGDKANVYFQNSIESAEQISAKAILGQAYREWGSFCKEKGEVEKADKYFAEASAYFSLANSQHINQVTAGNNSFKENQNANI